MTVVIFFILFFVLIGSTYLFLLNPQEVSVHLSRHLTVDISPVTLVLCSVAGGIFLIWVVSGFGSFAAFFKTRLAKRRVRCAKKSEELFTRGANHYYNGSFDAAERVLSDLLTCVPTHLRALHLMGNLKSKRGQMGDAVLYHTRVREMSKKDIENLYALASDFEKTDNQDKAIPLYLDIFDLDKRKVKPYEKIREIYVRSKNWEKAIEFQRKIVALIKDKSREGRENDRISWYKYQLALESIERGNLSAGVDILRSIVKLNVNFTPAYLKLVETCFVLEREKEGVQALENGYKHTGAQVFMIKLAEHYQSLGDDLATVRAYRRGIAVSANPAFLHLLLGDFFVRKGMAEEGVIELERARSFYNSTVFFHLTLAKGYKALNRHKEADSESNLAYAAVTGGVIMYECSFCRLKEREWLDACPGCGEFNSFSLDHKFATATLPRWSVP